MTTVGLKDIALSSPVLLIGGGSLLMLLVDVFMGKREWPRAFLAMAILLVALISLGVFYPPFQAGVMAFNGFVYADVFSWLITLLVLFGTMLTVLIGMNVLEQEGIESPGEYYSLLFMATAGAIVFATAAELVTLFIGLETMSMALYCLCGAALRSRRSSESALKYFLLGSFSSAIMLYGIALLYGITGTTLIEPIAEALSRTDTVLAHCSLALILIGFVFKIGAVPFHFWAPDVYEGAPTPVTAFMACVIKTSAVGAALRVLWVGFGGQVLFWSGTIWYVAVLTMILANLVALRQRSLKRMLAYSSIAHAGYMMMGFLSRGTQYDGGAAILYYLVVYTILTVGAFSVVLAVTAKHSANPHSDDISRFYGLAERNPFLALSMAVFMLGLAGIPPGMAGLLGKFYLFSAAVKANYVGLAIVGVLCSAVSAYYYLRVIVAMYFRESDGAEKFELLEPSVALGSVLTLCVIGAVFLGIFPSALYESAAAAMVHF
ncbi:MAG: NADH-quinone oxidoreductase subunit N [Oligoflexia bacterium]|nr:NADH-quinone oxidoreductase subunit N [Oligoflexia bacterium]